MLIFFQELCLLLFLWLLKLVDGLMEIFSAIAGVTDVTYRGERVNTKTEKGLSTARSIGNLSRKARGTIVTG